MHKGERGLGGYLEGRNSRVGLQEFFMLPRGFIFRMIIPLDLVELSSLVARDSILLVESLDGICLVRQIQFRWDDVFDNNIGQRL
jgi:hypothetical protein